MVPGHYQYIARIPDNKDHNYGTVSPNTFPGWSNTNDSNMTTNPQQRDPETESEIKEEDWQTNSLTNQINKLLEDKIIKKLYASEAILLKEIYKVAHQRKK